MTQETIIKENEVNKNEAENSAQAEGAEATIDVVEAAEEREAQPTNAAEPESAEAAEAGSEAEAETVDEATEEAEPTDAEVIAELREQLAAAEKKSEELVDKLQRTAAEFQNSRRRQEKQLSDAIERAGSHTVERLLPVMDDLLLAFGNLPADLDESTNAWVDGFRQIQKKLDSLLSDQGVTAIPLEGEFDPNRHEAVSNEPSESVESGHIIETLRVGYEYKGRVLRPALVRVAM